MSFSINKGRLFQHIIAVISALLICSGLYLFIAGHQIRPPYAGLHLFNIGKGKAAAENMVALNSALAYGKTMVVLGSSEMTSKDLTYIPYNFLPKSLNIPVLAYGHAYFQSFAINAMLRANADALSPRTRLVIMVSPGWFKISTIPLDSFIEHFQPQILVPLYQDNTAKLAIGRYVKQHFNEFGRISGYQSAFVVDPADINNGTHTDQRMQQALYNEQLFLFKTRARLLFAEPHWLIHPRQVPVPVSPSITQWNAYENQARTEEISYMKGNQHWVRDDYFRKYLSDLPASGTNYFPASLDANPEFENLTNVLLFLQEKNVQALVVMQPLNPYVYKDANRIRPIAQRLAILCRQTGMPYFDMTNEEYTPGTLRDGMHLGELGWARVDRQILNYMASQ